MKRGKRCKKYAWAFGLIAAIALIGFIAEKINRGIVMRPVRAFAEERLKITIDPPTLTDEEIKQSQVMAIEWHEACLKKYPTLAVDEHPVAPEENGFLQLYLLDGSLELSAEFRELLRMASEGYDPVVAQKLLAEHQEAASKTERIALIPTRSSINMPDDFMGFIGLMHIKPATEILLLKACLAADDGDAEQALHYIQLTGNVIQHLRDIETPFLLSETGAILFELSRQNVVLDYILPKLGKGAKLDTWLNELDIRAFDNQRLAELIRGEWYTGGRHLAFPFIAQMDLSGELADGKSCVMAYSEWMAKQARIHQNADPFEITTEADLEKEFEHLNNEQREIISVMHVGHSSWGRGYFRSAMITARSIATLELLMLEQSGETLTTESTQKVTKDPFTGNPFLFDPKTRELNITDNEVVQDEEPIKLPW